MRALGILATGLCSTLALTAAAADTIIVDIDSSQRNTDSPVIVSLEAGTYSVMAIGVAGGGAFDAWNPWGVATCAVSTGCALTVPTTEMGWSAPPTA